MKIVKYILIGTGILIALLLGARAVFSVQIGEALFRSAVKANLGQSALADAPDGLSAILVGTGSPLPDPGRVGPMTVVAAGDRIFIIDAGSGSARRFGELRLPWGNVEAVFLTHFHSDHIDGLGEVMLQHWAAGGAKTPLALHGPNGVERIAAGFTDAYAQDTVYRIAHHGADVISPSGQGAEAVAFTPSGRPEIVYERDGLTVSAVSVDHSPIEPAVAYRFDYRGRSVTISGDTVKDDRLVTLANGTDLLIHEALNADMVSVVRDELTANGETRLAAIMNDILDYHTTPVEAAEVAHAANVRMLALSHIVPAQPSRLLYPAYLKGTSKAYDGPIIMGEDGMMFTLPAGSDKIERRRLN